MRYTKHVAWYAGSYEAMELHEEGRNAFQSHTGKPDLDLRLLNVVAEELVKRGHEVVPADGFQSSLAELGLLQGAS